MQQDRLHDQTPPPRSRPQPLSCSKLSPVASLVLKGRGSGEQSVPAVCGVESALEGKGQIMKDSGVALPPPHPTPKKRKGKKNVSLFALTDTHC